MEQHISISKQCGFFDLGLSLVILAVGGGTALAVAQDENSETAVYQPQVVAVAEQEQYGQGIFESDCD